MTTADDGTRPKDGRGGAVDGVRHGSRVDASAAGPASVSASASDSKAVRGDGAGHPRTVLVLGGGGLKGIAHIGALRALEDAGVRPDAIIGTSIGALVGALHASGMQLDELEARALALEEDHILRVNRRVAWIRGLKQSSVYRGEPLHDYIRDALPAESFDDFATPFRLNAVSLNTGRQVWFGTGARTDLPPADAVYASSALPVYLPPLPVDGDHLVDGGVLDPLPVRTALRWASGPVIAVDVGADFEAGSAEPWVDHGIVGIHQRVMEIRDEKERRLLPPPGASPRVVHVHPAIGHLGTFDFGHADLAMERGYAAMAEGLEELAALEARAAAPSGAGERVRRWFRRVAAPVRRRVGR